MQVNLLMKKLQYTRNLDLKIYLSCDYRYKNHWKVIYIIYFYILWSSFLFNNFFIPYSTRNLVNCYHVISNLMLIIVLWTQINISILFKYTPSEKSPPHILTAREYIYNNIFFLIWIIWLNGPGICTLIQIL